jgi:pilus assembly protein CpaB
MYAKADIAAGIPLKRADVTPERSEFVLPVSPGNRAVSIEVDAVSGIEGHAAPGTRVDVVLTYYEGGELTSKVIVENTRVLSLGGDTTLVTDRGDIRKRGRSTASKTITLEVAPQDALKIQTARKMGSLGLIMRASGDNRPVQKREVSGADLGQNGSRANFRSRCERGTVRIPGKGDFILNCDGSMVRMPDSAASVAEDSE